MSHQNSKEPGRVEAGFISERGQCGSLPCYWNAAAVSRQPSLHILELLPRQADCGDTGQEQIKRFTTNIIQRRVDMLLTSAPTFAHHLTSLPLPIDTSQQETPSWPV